MCDVACASAAQQEAAQHQAALAVAASAMGTAPATEAASGTRRWPRRRRRLRRKDWNQRRRRCRETRGGHQPSCGIGCGASTPELRLTLRLRVRLLLRRLLHDDHDTDDDEGARWVPKLVVLIMVIYLLDLHVDQLRSCHRLLRAILRDDLGLLFLYALFAFLLLWRALFGVPLTCSQPSLQLSSNG